MVSYFERTIGRATREAPVLTARFEAWNAVDWAIAIYATYVAVVAVVFRETVAQWPFLLVGHAALVMALLLMPPRGAAWEQTRADDPAWRAWLRRTARFLRYTYPALLLTPFFEEVALTVNAASPGSPYWFESYLLAADRALFGGTPAVMLSQAGCAAARRSDARLLLRLLPADHLRHRDRLAWVGQARNPGVRGSIRR